MKIEFPRRNLLRPSFAVRDLSHRTLLKAFAIFLAMLTGVAGGAAESPPATVFFRLPSGALGLTNAGLSGSALKSYSLPVEAMRGAHVFVAANIKAREVSAKPQPWNGLKLMVKIETPGRTDWPQPALPVGTFDWQRFSHRVYIPPNATAATLTLGLENVSGAVWFEDVEVSLSRVLRPVPAAPPDQPIFRGHDLPRLRGAMVSPRMTEADLAILADDWRGNLIRWQLIRSNDEARSSVSYDEWLDGMLAQTDQALSWAKKHGVKVVLDLHSPPGGQASQGGYVAALGEIFSQPEAQQHFVEAWRKMARRYKGNSVIWGFDLLNEPVDDQTAAGCQDWQDLALTAGQAIREIDPERTLIVEPPRWGSPAGWAEFNPIPLPRVVYSFHMYEPSRFTHQRVFDKTQASAAYPGEIEGREWNRKKLLSVMQPAIDFARKHRVHLYVGEFSAIRWAPGAEKYLADLTSIFEEQGWDWTYHAFREWSGWSLEHSPDEQNALPATEKTARFKVIDHWFKQNPEPPKSVQGELKPAPAQSVGRRFACADYTQGKVFIVGADGKVEWEYPAQSCNDLWVLPGGNLLFTTGHGVEEVTREKKVVFSYQSKSEIYACQRLPNGNTFIGECSAARLLEIEPSGAIAKELRLLPEGKEGGHLYMRNARRLANGHYLVAHYGEQIVREYDERGKVVQEIPAASGPHSVVRLPNGHTLIACGDAVKDGARVFEVDGSGQTVWEIKNGDLPDISLKFMTGLQRLPNGNTIVSNWQGHNQFGTGPHLIEVTPQKKVVWKFDDHQTWRTVSSVQIIDIPGDATRGEVWH